MRGPDLKEHLLGSNTNLATDHQSTFYTKTKLLNSPTSKKIMKKLKINKNEASSILMHLDQLDVNKIGRASCRERV